MKGADDLKEHPSGEEEIIVRCEESSKMAVLRGGGDLQQGVEEMIGERGRSWQTGSMKRR